MGGTDLLNKQRTGFQPSICVNVHPDNHTKGSETNKEENSTCQEHMARFYIFLFIDKKK
jgi:hypothetical protein